MGNLSHDIDIYLVNVKTMRKISQIFVAFLEKLNFTTYIVKICLNVKQPNDAKKVFRNDADKIW